MNLEQAVKVVREIYNIPFELKSEQMDIIKTIVEKESVIGIPPTGFGKTLTYVVPPLILDQVSCDSFCLMLITINNNNRNGCCVQ